MCILLGYGHDIKSVKLLSLVDGGVLINRLENLFCYEKFTAGHDHVVRVLTRDLSLSNAEPAIPIVQIKSGIETYPEGDEIARQVVAGVTLEGQVADLAEISLEVEKKCADTAVDIERSPAVQAQWADTAADGLRSGTVPTQCADTVVKSKTAKKGNNRRKRKCSAKESDDSADEHPFILRKSTVAPVKVLPRRRRARPSHLCDFVFNVVEQSIGAVQIPQSYCQVRASKL
ncbi:hypothetical protein PC129_g5034 [Phytophthora cactorum]|uniref:Uncharacterized protein n=1 Tax=Phytophthora cactorum TaxID=29920 RepID=A0A8T1CV72_9STRA|nr:hypothetical protein Pcac1_g27596 [Phytophthora cactorum]KAG2831366.1 hypothetical protein PC112_g7303 [Phytophthora cactorum]KAG2833714.1 hypothetical protein PC111_g6111 [Phytophthora cactorum]KAG2861562.1 hypothetical protein PC113_g7061 [Phytophthora cactorum]KAG2916639.1 hypothetical protein PC114_g7413 [Phytophthora cactorum]